MAMLNNQRVSFQSSLFIQCQERELQAERERLERLKATKEEQAELVGSW